jgi:hypothetical protein
MDSLRRVAVTVTSSIPDEAAASVVTVCARAAPTQVPSTAAMAQASFWLFCKIVSHRLRGKGHEKTNTFSYGCIAAKEIHTTYKDVVIPLGGFSRRELFFTYTTLQNDYKTRIK